MYCYSEYESNDGDDDYDDANFEIENNLDDDDVAAIDYLSTDWNFELSDCNEN